MKTLLIAIFTLAALTLSAATSPESIRVPGTVERQIKADAVEKWPSDYQMQAYTIGKQTKAYKELYAWAKDNRSSSVFKEIFEAAQKKWPGDYQMQLYTVEKQIEAYNKVHGN